MRTRFAELDAAGVLVMVGPSISDNALIAAPLCDAARAAARSTTPAASARGSEWMFHYQIGSLEEEPAVLAQRMVDRGFAARRGDRSTSRRSGAATPRRSKRRRARLGLDVTGSARDLAAHRERWSTWSARLRDGQPDVLVYFGLGCRVARRVARARGARRGTCRCSRTPR